MVLVATAVLAASFAACSSSGSGDLRVDPVDTGDGTGGKLVETGFGQRGQYALGVAIVKNTSGRGGATVTVTFDFTDDDGAVVESVTQAEHFSWADQELAVTAFAVLASEDVHVASLEATLLIEDNGDFADNPPGNIGVVTGTIKPGDAEGYWEVRFMLRNRDAQVVDDARVGVVCWDGSGTIIGGDSVYPEPIAASTVLEVASDPTLSAKPRRCKAYVGSGM